MIDRGSLATALRQLKIDSARPVIVHTALSAFGEVKGGAEAVLEALLGAFETVVMPTFTYKVMLVPEAGPPENGLKYGSQADANRMVEFYHPDMPADRLMGILSETLRQHPLAHRSKHPILSFAGVNADSILGEQSLVEPLAPIRKLTERRGWVLLMGVDHSTNTSIHYAEKLAGRKQFIRWALTGDGVAECPGFPGCSDGFNEIAPLVEPARRWEQVGNALIQALPLTELVETTRALIRANPLALLCNHSYCERCQAVRDQVAKSN